MPPMVTIITGDLTTNSAINHNTGKIHAEAATVFFRCFLLKKSIQCNWPNKSEKIRVRAASAEKSVEKSTINEPNRKKLLVYPP